MSVFRGKMGFFYEVSEKLESLLFICLTTSDELPLIVHLFNLFLNFLYNYKNLIIS